MSVEKFKEAILTPLMESIQQHKATTLGMLQTEQNVLKQFYRAEGLEAAASFIIGTYNNMFNPQPPADSSSANVEIIPPQA